MPLFGALGILVAFAASVGSAVLLLLGYVLEQRKAGSELAETLSWSGRVVALVCAAALTFCVGILAVSFLTDNYAINYVLDNRSTNTGALAWLYKLSGVWAGREGSLLFWTWLIGVFGAVVSAWRLNRNEQLDNMAVMVVEMVLIAFVGVLLFSNDNMPFFASEAYNFNADGTLTAAAEMLGMNNLLEHWAMAVHPPTLFIGYAGLTVPFAYALAALITGDASATWVNRSTRYALVSWLFLTIGIGLGAVWAYVVLGWGGYWGWDPVENASLLSWLVATALIHSFTLYRSRGAAKGWSVMCAGLTFSFVIVGTFISRSGLVQSVHAFAGDPVSLYLFLALIIAGIVLPAVGLLLRRGLFTPDEGADDFESFFSKNAMYFVNNVVMVAMACVLAYMTLSSALPTWLPFGGQSLSISSYNALARPLGMLYLLVMAVCPLVGWHKTDPKAFARLARIPGICAAVLFAVLLGYTVLRLFPAYDATIAAGGSFASDLLENGPAIYYKGLTIFGMAVASILFFNSLFLLVRAIKAHRKRVAAVGGAIAHIGMAVVLVGLIGSSMYVSEKTGYLQYDPEANTSQDEFVINQYVLRFTDGEIYTLDNGNACYRIEFDVFTRSGEGDGATETLIGHVEPSIELVSNTQQQKLNAGVLGFPLEDLFVVYKGLSATNDGLSLDVRVNPLISFVWVGFGLLMVGMAVSAVGKRGTRKLDAASDDDVDSVEDTENIAQVDADEKALKE